MKLLLLLLLLAVTACTSPNRPESRERYRVYNAYLNAKIGYFEASYNGVRAALGEDTTGHQLYKTRSVVLMPTQEGHNSLNEIAKLVKAAQPNFQPPAFMLQEVAKPEDFLSSWQNDWPFAPRHNTFKEWLGTDLANSSLVLKIDSLMPHTAKLENQFALRCQSIVVSNPAQFTRNFDWSAFHASYPSCFGLVELSDVAFSEDKCRAAFYTSESRGGLDGTGNAVFMKLTSRGWVVEFVLNLWVS